MVRSCLLFGVALCSFLALGLDGRAAVLEEGGVTITPTLVEVGILSSPTGGEGTLRITPPSLLTTGTLNVGRGTSTSRVMGRVFVEGAALNAMSVGAIGESGIGLLQITGGGLADFGKMLTIGGVNPSAPLAEGTVIVDGAGSKMRLGGTMTVGEYGLGELYLANGATIMPLTPQQSTGVATIANRMGSVGNVFVRGDNTQWQQAGKITVGNFGTGALYITEGGNVSSNGASVGESVEGSTGVGFGTAVIDGLGSRWSTTSLVIGDRGTGEVRVTDGGLLDVTNSFQQQAQTTLGRQLNSFGRLIISGPSSRWVDSRPAIIGSAGVGELWIEDGANIVNGGASIGGSSSSGQGAAYVRGERTRWQAASLMVGADGRGDLTQNALLEISDGATVVVGGSTSSPFIIGARGRVSLRRGTLSGRSDLGFQSGGLLEGDGSVSVGTYTNASNGRVAVGPGQHLTFTGSLSSTSNSRIDLDHGELEALRSFNTSVGAIVVADGSVLRARGSEGFGHQGTMSLIGANRVYGLMRNSGAIIVASQGQTTFYNDVQNNGALTAAAGSSVRFVGALINKGVAGPGMASLEGNVSPGFSTAAMEFGGSATLGDLSTLNIELRALESGEVLSDQVFVNNTANLGGRLNLMALTDLAAPATITILHAGELAGQFSSVPALGQTVGNGVRFNGITYDYLQDAVKVSLLPAVPQGFMLDNVVDGEDFLTWQRQLGTTDLPAGSGADANADGAVDAADLQWWRDSLAEHSPQQAAVPEPGTVTLVLFAAALGFCRLRRS